MVFAPSRMPMQYGHTLMYSWLCIQRIYTVKNNEMVIIYYTNNLLIRLASNPILYIKYPTGNHN